MADTTGGTTPSDFDPGLPDNKSEGQAFMDYRHESPREKASNDSKASSEASSFWGSFWKGRG